MSKARRLFLSGLGITVVAFPVRWTKPVINTVILPSHAQCSASNISGRWEISVVGSKSDIDGIYTDTFETDLLLDDYPHIWSYDGTTSFEIHNPGTDTLYTASTVNSICTEMSGTYDNRAGICAPHEADNGCPEPVIVSGTWTGIRL